MGASSMLINVARVREEAEVTTLLELCLPRDRFDHASVPMGAQRHGEGFSDLGETGLSPQLLDDVQQLPKD